MMDVRNAWTPTVEAFALLVTAYLREASDELAPHETRRALYKNVITMYRDIMTGSEKRKVNKEPLLRNARAMQLILQAVVSLEAMEDSVKHKTVLRKIGSSLAQLECWTENDRSRKDRRLAGLLQEVARWKEP